MSILTIYYGDRQLILTDAISDDLKDSFNGVHEYSNAKDLKQFLNRFIENADLREAYVFWHSLDGLLDLIKKQFRFLEAAGGIVSNPQGELLFIFRRGKWDLPKGKCEKGETIKETAIREVEEECGLTDLKLLTPLPSSYHIYIERDKVILKQTWWYTMTAPNQIGVPQLEEDIVKVEWLNKHGLDKVMANTFPSVINVIKSV